MPNSIHVVGNVTKAPELKYMPTGNAMCNFGVADNRRWQNKQTNEWEESVSFFDVTVWGEQAEYVAASCEKGTRVIVTGRLQQRSWETDAGEKRYAVGIVADEVGPSLRWAEAVVTKIEKSQGREAGQSSQSYDNGPDFG